jgi:hypothetical protein
MLLRPEYLSQELDRPLPTKDGGTLRTIRDACNYMTSMGKKRELRSHWQRACKLILAKEDVLTVSRALELALFMDAKLEVGGTRQGREAEQRPTRKREQNMAYHEHSAEHLCHWHRRRRLQTGCEASPATVCLAGVGRFPLTWSDWLGGLALA